MTLKDDKGRELQLELNEGGKVRWTDNDKEKSLLNAETARVKAIDHKGVTVSNAQGVEVGLEPGDPMLQRLDIGYAMNTHQL